MLLPALPGVVHFGFGVNAQGVGDAVDVVEIGDHLDGVEDIAIA